MNLECILENFYQLQAKNLQIFQSLLDSIIATKMPQNIACVLQLVIKSER